MRAFDRHTLIALISPGDMISYTLLPKDSPCNPAKIWHGKVIRCDANTFYVEVLEPGYYNLKEHIQRQQIIAVED